MLTGKTFVDTLEMPFSRRGSYISFGAANGGSNEYGKAQLWLSTSRQRAMDANLGGMLSTNNFRQVRLEPVKDGIPRLCVVHTTPYEIALECTLGSISFCIGDYKYARCRGTDGLTLRLTSPFPQGMMGSAMFNLLDGSWKMRFGNYFLLLVPTAGTLRTGPAGTLELVPDENGVIDMVIEESLVDPKKRDSYLTYDECLEAVKADFDGFCNRVAPSFPPQYADQGKRVLWTLWGLTVIPDGETIYKHQMIKMIRCCMEGAFSWQQGMHAMFLAENDLKLAWELLLSCFDNQDRTGRIADALAYNAAGPTMKPPVQGLALTWLMDHYDISGMPEDEMQHLWNGLEKWTQFFLNYRDLDCDGIYEYHNAGETGWEDSRYYRIGFPLAQPGMNGLLAIQQEALARLGRLIGKSEDICTFWEKKSKDTIRKIIDMFWTQEGWTGINIVTNERSDSTGIELYTTLLLGKRLPQEIIDRSIELIYKVYQFETPFGLASESLDSPYFMHGWCGGSICTPVEALMAIAFDYCGRKDLSRDIAEKYLKTIIDHGIYHIHDVYTGECEYGIGTIKSHGEEDIFYSGWTAGCYVFFSHRYAK